MLTINVAANLVVFTEVFNKECRRVVNILGESNNVFLNAVKLSDTWLIETNTHNVSCYSQNLRQYCGSFPIDYLTKTDEELRKMAQDSKLLSDKECLDYLKHLCHEKDLIADLENEENEEDDPA